MTSMDWEARKAEIKRLYLVEGKTLKALMQIMESSYGFYQVKSQYVRKLKQWDFQKYNAGPAKWKYVKHNIKKRKQQGKESDVYINGILQEPKKVKYETGRQAFQSTFEKFCSVVRGYVEIVSQLLDAGADVDAPGSDEHGRTALEGAAEYGRLDILRLLLSRGASIEGAYRRQLVRAVKLADYMGYSAAARLLKSLDT